MIAAISAGAASAAGLETVPVVVSVFPSSLLYIENEAFEGTAFQAVFLPDGFLRIGDRAFQDTPSLHRVYIPQTTEFIGVDSFPQNELFEIHGVEGSYADDWAKQQHIFFIPDYSVALRVLGRQQQTAQSNSALNSGQISDSETEARFKGQCENKDRSMRPQDRPELNPIDYKFP